jgi:predicted transcriptional regulator of viral defense system
MVKMKLFEFQVAVGRLGLRVFSALEFQRLLGMRLKAAQALLGRYAKRGVLVKLRNNYYALAANPPTPYLVSNRIYQPSYVSFESALSYHGIIPETVYSVTAATTRATREFSVQGAAYTYHRIKREAYTGYGPLKVGEETVLMAEPEKALADYLYFASLGRKTLNDRMRLDRLSMGKLIGYSRLYGRKRFTEYMENAIRRTD